MAIVPPSITNATVVCAECGRIATDMHPTPPDGNLLCLCRPCDVLWRVEEVDVISDTCPACESDEASLYEQNTDQGMTSFCSYGRCGHDWTEVA